MPSAHLIKIPQPVRTAIPGRQSAPARSPRLDRVVSFPPWTTTAHRHWLLFGHFETDRQAVSGSAPTESSLRMPITESRANQFSRTSLDERGSPRPSSPLVGRLHMGWVVPNTGADPNRQGRPPWHPFRLVVLGMEIDRDDRVPGGSVRQGWHRPARNGQSRLAHEHPPPRDLTMATRQLGGWFETPPSPCRGSPGG